MTMCKFAALVTNILNLGTTLYMHLSGIEAAQWEACQAEYHYSMAPECDLLSKPDYLQPRWGQAPLSVVATPQYSSNIIRKSMMVVLVPWCSVNMFLGQTGCRTSLIRLSLDPFTKQRATKSGNSSP